MIWLDVARLVERACIGSLTGVDRVELAYAEALTAVAQERTRFVMLSRGCSRLVALPHEAMLRFIDGIRSAWQTWYSTYCQRSSAPITAVGRYCAGSGGRIADLSAGFASAPAP